MDNVLNPSHPIFYTQSTKPRVLFRPGADLNLHLPREVHGQPWAAPGPEGDQGQTRKQAPGEGGRRVEGDLGPGERRGEVDEMTHQSLGAT